MTKIDCFIKGIPYSQNKVRGNIEGPREWSRIVVRDTANLPKLKGKCKATIVYYLPPDKYPSDHPYGSDLDNLTKRFFDSLNETVFSDAPGKDGCVVELSVSKVAANSEKDAGVSLKIEELK